MDILTRLKHGRSSWEKIMKQVQRAKKAEEKEEELKRSMEVRVGRVRH